MRLISHPSIALLLQFPNPVLHVIAQFPPLQLATPLLDEEALPQLPQLLTLVRVLTSQPSPTRPLQFANPLLHITPQLAEEHIEMPFAASGQARPQPLARMPSQLPKLAEHCMPQMAFEHDGRPFGKGGQGVVQLPQLLVLVRRLTSQSLMGLLSQFAKG
jgi:hypothetical protein